MYRDLSWFKDPRWWTPDLKHQELSLQPIMCPTVIVAFAPLFCPILRRFSTYHRNSLESFDATNSNVKTISSQHQTEVNLANTVVLVLFMSFSSFDFAILTTSDQEKFRSAAFFRTQHTHTHTKNGPTKVLLAALGLEASVVNVPC